MIGREDGCKVHPDYRVFGYRRFFSFVGLNLEPPRRLQCPEEDARGAEWRTMWLGGALYEISFNQNKSRSSFMQSMNTDSSDVLHPLPSDLNISGHPTRTRQPRLQSPLAPQGKSRNLPFFLSSQHHVRSPQYVASQITITRSSFIHSSAVCISQVISSQRHEGVTKLLRPVFSFV